MPCIRPCFIKNPKRTDPSITDIWGITERPTGPFHFFPACIYIRVIESKIIVILCVCVCVPTLVHICVCVCV